MISRACGNPVDLMLMEHSDHMNNMIFHFSTLQHFLSNLANLAYQGAQWLSSRVLGFRVHASLSSLVCVLEQDT